MTIASAVTFCAAAAVLAAETVGGRRWLPAHTNGTNWTRSGNPKVGYTEPNIILMVADDIGFTDLGYFGYDLAGATPLLDQLAGEGIKFSNWYGGHGCTPGRAAALTGLYPMRMGFQSGAIGTQTRKSVPVDHTMIQNELKVLGYATAMIGKWHVGHASWDMTPLFRDFDYFQGFMCSGAIDFVEKTNGNYFDMFTTVAGDQHVQPFGHVDPTMMGTDYRTSDIYEKGAVTFIQNHAAAETGRPFFMYWAHQDPHTPLSSPAEFSGTEPCSKIGDETRQTYCGMMRSLDTNVESMMVELERKFYLDNTLIIFTGDNGGAPKNGGYNYPWRGSKGTLFDGGIKQVTWMWGAMLPDDARGSSHDGVFHHADLLPTLLSVASSGHWKWHRSDYAIDGVDQWSTVRGAQQSPRGTPGVSAGTIDTLLNCIDDSGGIRIGDYVLLLNTKDDGWYPQPESDGTFRALAKNNQTETPAAWSSKRLPHQRPQLAADKANYLFNVATDPYQEVNLYDAMPDLVAQMTAPLEAYIAVQGCYACDTDKENAATEAAAATGYWVPWLG